MNLFIVPFIVCCDCIATRLLIPLVASLFTVPQIAIHFLRMIDDIADHFQTGVLLVILTGCQVPMPNRSALAI